MAATVNLVARLGYNGATTREIAKLAGLNEGTIFRCFGCKRDLFDAAIAHELSGLRLRADVVAQMAIASDPRACMLAMVRLISDIASSRPDLVRMLHFCALEFGDEFGLIIRKHLGPAIDGIVTLFRRWSAEGRIRVLDPLATAVSLVAVIVSIHTIYPLLADGRLTPVLDKDAIDAAVANHLELWCGALTAVPAMNSDSRGGDSLPPQLGCSDIGALATAAGSTGKRN